MKYKTLVDIDQPFDIDVKKRDIKTGVTGNANACAAAQSLLRRSDVIAAKVTRSTTVYITADGVAHRGANSGPLRTAIDAFDYGVLIHPGSYIVEVPEGSDALPYIEAKNERRNQRIAAGTYVPKATPNNGHMKAAEFPLRTARQSLAKSKA